MPDEPHRLRPAAPQDADPPGRPAVEVPPAATPPAPAPTPPASAAAPPTGAADILAQGGRRRSAVSRHAAVVALTRRQQAVRAWSGGPLGRVWVPAGLVVLLLGALVLAGVYLVPALAGQPAAGPAAGPEVAPATPDPGVTVVPSSAPGQFPTSFPTGQPTFGAPAGRPADVLVTWAQPIALRLGLPPVAIQAYGYAELVLAQTAPACHLSWTTLAAIGRVESNHGRTNGAQLLADGRALPAIIGLPLDGQGGRRQIRDTDLGALDGDRTYDRAVGPMQFIPSTWQISAIDADGDGIRDPNDIDDAALAAAGYLCRSGRDLTRPADWWAAILSYNNVPAYAQSVFDAANQYGQQSRT